MNGDNESNKTINESEDNSADKKPRAFLIEDISNVQPSIIRLLEKEHVNFLRCHNIDLLELLWNENADSIDYIMTNLCMDASGLTIKEQENSSGGLFTGWILVKRLFLEDSKHFYKRRRRVLIISEYIDDFEQHVSFMSPQEQQFYNDYVTCINFTNTDWEKSFINTLGEVL